MKIFTYIGPLHTCSRNIFTYICRNYGIKSPVGIINHEERFREQELPEFTYSGKNEKIKNIVYGMGCVAHGALGSKFFFPSNFKHKLTTKTTYIHRPYRVFFSEVNDVLDIACGYGFTVFAVKPPPNTSYTCFGTGLATNCQIGLHKRRNGITLGTVIEPTPINIPLKQDTRVTKVACGRAHTIVSTNTGEVWTFGSNSYGQCGRKVIENECFTRVYFHRIESLEGRNIQQIECGQDTSFVLSDGKVYSCGFSADGQSGQGTFKNVESFAEVFGDIQGENIIKVASKGDCILALNDKGQVFGWGNSEYGQLRSVADDQQVSIPRVLPFKLPKIIDIAAGGSSCFVLTEDGEVFSWGFGILGRGPVEKSSLEPRPIPRPLFGKNVLSPNSKVVKIFSGVTECAAINSEGGLYTWGRNAFGMLGLGMTEIQHFPLRVCMTSVAKKVSIGIDHTMVMVKTMM